MRLKWVDLSNVRLFSKVRFCAESGINLIYGDNGSGKTSLLEGISLLSRVRSFRTGRLNEVIKKGETYLTVSANILTDQQDLVVSGVERRLKQTRIRFNGRNIRQTSEQARNLPILILTPESQRILVGSPRDRRRWLNWLMFHVEPSYLQVWSDYYKNLRHRNQLLRTRAKPTEFIPWEQEMSLVASAIKKGCMTILNKLQTYFQQELEYFLSEEGMVNYFQGWDQRESLLWHLEKMRSSEQEVGYTGKGPHRADIKFFYGDQEAGKVLSRGQARLYVIGLLLAQTRLIKKTTGKNPILLLDDVFSDLDSTASSKLSQRLHDIDVQCFISCTEKKMKRHCSGLFHVKQGKIKKSDFSRLEAVI